MCPPPSILEASSVASDVRHAARSPRFLALLTLEGQVVEANAYSLDLAGLNLDHTLGMHFSELRWWRRSVESKVRLREALKEAAAGHGGCRAVEAVRDDGKPVRLHLFIGPLGEAGQPATHLVATGIVQGQFPEVP